MEWAQQSIHVQRLALTEGEISSLELTKSYLKRIESFQSLGAYLETNSEAALSRAKQADEALASGDRLPLLGIPIAVKDNICVQGFRATCASKMLKEFEPQYDSEVCSRLKSAGAVLLGKTNMDEFAMGSSTENSAFQITRNPWDTDRVPGGSSGGSAVAVSAGLCSAALGSDTGGSIRQPAAMCGVVGLKPTYGRVSRRGLIAYASTLDQIGPMARSVEDCAILFDVLAGHDPLDSSSSSRDRQPLARGLNGGVAGLKIGIDSASLSEGLDPQVAEAVMGAARALQSKGAILIDVSLPLKDHLISIYYLIATAEASSNLARFDGVGYGHRTENLEGLTLLELYKKSRAEAFGTEVKRRIMLGTYALSAGYFDAYYGRAQGLRQQLKDKMLGIFDQVDLLLGPTAPTTAFLLGEKKQDPMSMYLSDIYTIPANLAGLPALSMPCGLDRLGLPIGLHLTAAPFQEQLLLSAAKSWEDVGQMSGCNPPGFEASGETEK